LRFIVGKPHAKVINLVYIASGFLRELGQCQASLCTSHLDRGLEHGNLAEERRAFTANPDGILRKSPKKKNARYIALKAD